ncbi:unnamed protein product [Cyclocybe aegerita]|uniref:Uncharacterized protein n=1 Tax=Cyclocybe aegerita TaxID=1973307 RepID=A0A8S0XQA6_CYCAE|nr:unnamed protein product [Cyclocybe aegerita]
MTQEPEHIEIQGTERPLAPRNANTAHAIGGPNDDLLLPAIATLLATIPATLLSYARDTFANRASNEGPAHKPTDDTITTLWFVSIVLALFSVILRRRATPFTRYSLTASVITLLTGLLVFSWAEQPRAVSITFTVVVGCVLFTAAFYK